MTWYKRSQISQYSFLAEAQQFDNFPDYQQHIWNKSPEAKKQMVQEMEKYINDHFEAFSSTVLYHGSPEAIEQFDLVKGKRSGFMGSIKEVDNQAVFLSESPEIARSFGANRSDYGQSFLMKVRAKIYNTLDMDNIRDPELRQIAFQYMQQYDGKKRRHIPKSFHFNLLDHKPFVDKAKELGYDSASFTEERGSLRQLGVSTPEFSSRTIAVFYPENLLVENKKNTPIQNLEDVWEIANSKTAIAVRQKCFLHKKSQQMLKGYKGVGYDTTREIAYSFWGGKDALIDLTIGKWTYADSPQGIYLETSKQFVLDYYSGMTDDPDLLLTYEFDIKDAINNPAPNSEVRVKKAKLIDIETIEK